MTANVYRLAPPGIDIFARRDWAIRRRTGRRIRDDLMAARKACAFEPDTFRFACGKYIGGLETSLADAGRPGRALIRLGRAYARRFHREIVDEARYIEACRRRLLLGSV
jgi:hypothetical protein